MDITTPVIIVGVHRSGTSMLTRMLEKLGLFVGNDLQGDHESKSFISINNKYFMNHDASWDDPVYPRQEDYADNIIRRVFNANRDMLSNQFGPMDGKWAFKDPRTLTTLPLWLDLFPGAKVIYIRRSPMAAAKSLTARHLKLVDDGLFPRSGDFKKGNIKFTQRCSSLEGSMDFVLEQIKFVNRMKRKGIMKGHLELSYEELVADPIYHLAHISRYLDLKFTKNQLFAAAALPRGVDSSQFETALKCYFKN